MTIQLDSDALDRLSALGQALVNQEAARVIVSPNDAATGFWFGGGNMVQTDDGSLYVVGRYRNAGDSRLGVSAGTSGLELAVFRSTDKAATFEKVVSLSKADLNVNEATVLSIEGTALRVGATGVELFVSTEKQGIGYPAGFESFLKPGAGVWTIDLLQADSIESLQSATVQPLLSSNDPEFLHIKDPFVYQSGAETTLLFCSHPFSWSSSNTGHCHVESGNAGEPNHTFFP